MRTHPLCSHSLHLEVSIASIYDFAGSANGTDFHTSLRHEVIMLYNPAQWFALVPYSSDSFEVISVAIVSLSNQLIAASLQSLMQWNDDQAFSSLNQHVSFCSALKTEQYQSAFKVTFNVFQYNLINVPRRFLSMEYY